MKQEAQDIATAAAKLSVGIGGTVITLDHLVAFATLVFLLVQIVYLLRKWWREETEWGRKIKRWAEKHGITRPAPLE